MNKYTFNCCVILTLLCAITVVSILFNKHILTEKEFIFLVVLSNGVLLCCLIMCCMYACFDYYSTLARSITIAPAPSPAVLPVAEPCHKLPEDTMVQVKSGDDICIGKECTEQFTVVVINPCFDDLHTLPS